MGVSTGSHCKFTFMLEIFQHLWKCVTVRVYGHKSGSLTNWLTIIWVWVKYWNTIFFNLIYMLCFNCIIYRLNLLLTIIFLIIWVNTLTKMCRLWNLPSFSFVFRDCSRFICLSVMFLYLNLFFKLNLEIKIRKLYPICILPVVVNYILLTWL